MSIDQAVYKRPALCASARLRKVCHLQIVGPSIPPDEHGLRRTLGKRARGTKRDLQRAMDRMPVEGIAETPAVEDHIARRYRTVGLWNWDGTLERINRALYTAV